MTILQTVRQATEPLEARARLGEFLKTCQLVALRGTDDFYHEHERATERVQRIVKAPITALSTQGPGSAIAEYTPLSDAFAASLIGLSVFDTLLANGMRRVPLRTSGSILVVAPTGSGVVEGNAKPVSSMQFGSGAVDPQKVWSALVTSAELLKFAIGGAASLFNEELRKAVTRSTDAVFLAGAIQGLTPIVSAGGTFANLLTDLGALLAAVQVEPGSKLFLVAPVAKAQQWALMTTGAGDLAFPELSVTSGGPLVGGVEVLISDQLPANRLVLIVADGWAGNADAFELKQLRQGDIQLSSTPDNPVSAATVLSSMWQNNLLALAVERFLGFEAIRAGAVATLSY